MIKYDTTDHRVEIKGSIMQLVPESIFLFHEIYNMILGDKNNGDSEKMAEYFKNEIINALPYAFISKDELRNENERIEKENEERLEKIKDSLDKLGELIKLLEESENETEDIRSADFNSDEEFSKWLHGDD